MKYSQEEILKALHVIKDVCFDEKDCEPCPFYHENRGCLICEDSPEMWDINSGAPWKGLL